MKVKSVVKQTSGASTAVSTYQWDGATPEFVGAFRAAVLSLAAIVTSMGAQQLAGLGGSGSGARSTFSFEYSVSGDGDEKYFEQFPSTWYNLAQSDVDDIKSAMDMTFANFKDGAQKTKTKV